MEMKSVDDVKKDMQKTSMRGVFKQQQEVEADEPFRRQPKGEY